MIIAAGWWCNASGLARCCLGCCWHSYRPPIHWGRVVWLERATVAHKSAILTGRCHHPAAQWACFFSLARRNVCGDRQNRYCCPGWEQTPGSRTCTKRESLNADKRTSSAKQLVAPVYYEPVFMLQRFVLVAVAAADASDLTSVSAETASSVPPVNKTPVSTLSIIHL